MNMPQKLSAVFLTLPFCALIIVVLRNLFGFKSFGIFMPMLVGVSCAFTGLVLGLAGMLLIVAIALVVQWALNWLNLLKIPKLALTIVLVNAVILLLLVSTGQLRTETAGFISLFPVIVISFVADKIHDLVEQKDYRALCETVMGSAVSICLCYGAIVSASLVGMLILYPEIYLTLVAALLYIGQWTGLRISELLRFKCLIKKGQAVVGMNQRNRRLVGELNTAQDLCTAADKLSSKQRLQSYNIPVPKTLAKFTQLADIEALKNALHAQPSFVIKPNTGSQGNGILVIKGRDGDAFIGPENRHYSLKQLQKLVQEIINGNYSQLGDSDSAYIEELVVQHSTIQTVAPYGLSDIRVVLVKGKVTSAMLRIPTTQSDGKANLHQGALGAAVNLATGEVERCLIKGKEITHHPDSQRPITGMVVPHWQEILKICQQCYTAIPLGYMGVDICLDAQQGPLVLEVNGRPGLEIQNVNQSGLLSAAMPATA